MLSLVLGGARSGKSAYAEALIGARPATYIATYDAGLSSDPEMADRLARHRATRPAAWSTVEAPLELAATVRAHASAERPLLVDCLTLWLTNLLLAGRDCAAAIAELAEALPGLTGEVVLVANEVGLGIVPDNALARAFRDHAGRLNQAVAAKAGRVVFVAAGLPLILKEPA